MPKALVLLLVKTSSRRHLTKMLKLLGLPRADLRLDRPVMRRATGTKCLSLAQMSRLLTTRHKCPSSPKIALKLEMLRNTKKAHSTLPGIRQAIEPLQIDIPFSSPPIGNGDTHLRRLLVVGVCSVNLASVIGIIHVMSKEDFY